MVGLVWLHHLLLPLTPDLDLCPPPMQIIDVNYYPVESARNSNLKHRPIGIGVQVGWLPGC